MGAIVRRLAVYILAGLHRRRLRSGEAAMKYFVLGAFSSAIFLYGIAMVYGATGSTNLVRINDFLAQNYLGSNALLLVGIALLLVGFGFKVAAVPFHTWTPDVYEGSPTPITAFFSIAPKTEAMALFLRVMIEAMPGAIHEWRQIVVFVSVLSMFLGSVAAIGQDNIKRLMAYS